MKIPELFSVKPIQFQDIRQWLLRKHYAHRIPSISYSFGLFDVKGALQAVCSFGRPVAHTLIKNVLQGQYQNNILELNRLCASENLPRNALSYFVSKCLKLLPPPNANCFIRRYFVSSSWIYLPSDKLAIHGSICSV